ncbi:MAG: F0F1 ATP synthase subunit beta, partial [Aquiluna sp.]
VSRARRIQQFLSQNTYMATKFTGIEGSTVSLKDTVEGFRMIADGELDHVPEQAFFNCGGIDDVMKAYERIKKDLG